MRAALHLVERDLDHKLGPHVDDVSFAMRLAREELLRLPLEHLVGHPLERLSEHNEATGCGMAGANVDVAEPSLPATRSPLDREHDEIERARRLDLDPRRAAPTGDVRRR